MTIFNAYGSWKGHWIAMLQDFHFKNIHRANAKHANIDALNKDSISMHEEDENFGNEIQDLEGIQRSL